MDNSRFLSLYFHLPFCRSACYFCGCNVVFTSKEDKKVRYMDYLRRELEILSKHADTSREVIQMHFGGGTPTYFSALQLDEIIKMIKGYFPNFSKEAERPDEKLAIMQYTIDFLTSNGYKMVGMDHFAKPEDELFKAIDKGELHRNFQGYTTKGGADLLGIGLTSIGEGSKHYAQNFKEMGLYEEAIDAGKLPFERGVLLSEDDLIRKYVIMELMSNFKLDIRRFENKFGINFQEYFKDALRELQPFEDDGLLSIDDNYIICSETGM